MNSILRRQLLAHEEIRFHTFDGFNAHGQIEPSLLAYQGFYFENATSNVHCFACEFYLNNWAAVDVAKEHFRQFGCKCPLLTGRVTSIRKICQTKTSECLGKPNCSNSKDLVDLNERTDPEITVDNIVSRTAQIYGPSSLNYFHPISSKLSINIPGERLVDKIPFEDIFRVMKNESQRRRTFIVKDFEWKSEFPYEKLAKFGFFYTFIADIVQCAFCRIVIGGWDQTDQLVTGRHRVFSPKCLFLQSPTCCGNVAINERLDPERQITCKICFESGVEVAFQNCGHAICCLSCYNRVRPNCPICKRPIEQKILRIYL